MATENLALACVVLMIVGGLTAIIGGYCHLVSMLKDVLKELRRLNGSR